MESIILTPDLKLHISRSYYKKTSRKYATTKYNKSEAVCKDVRTDTYGSSFKFSCQGCSSIDESHTFKDGE